MRHLPFAALLSNPLPRHHLPRAATAAALLLAAQLPAQANWTASISTQELDQGLIVSSSSGSYTWTTLQEGWGASFGTNGSIPNAFTFQGWDGSRWPLAYFGDSVSLPVAGSTSAVWYHIDNEAEAYKLGTAIVTGPLSGGLSAGAFLLHDVRLVVAPFSSVEVTYLGDNHLIELGHDAGDAGVAFGQIKLYGSALDLNDPGGANQPYFSGLLSLSGGSAGDSQLNTTGDHKFTFENTTAQAQTHMLRFEASVLVFTTPPVPEPQTWALWLAGLGLLGAAAQRRHQRPR